jgi:hypothetical protein
MRGLRFLAIGLASACLLVCTSSAGADPFTITSTQNGNLVNVGIVVDDGGTAHVAWTDKEGLSFPDTQVIYCQIDPGTTECDSNTRRVLAHGVTGQSSGGTPVMVKDGGHIIVYDHFIDGVLMWESTNNGDSWTSPVKVWDQELTAAVGTGGLTTVFGISHKRVDRLEPTFNTVPAENLTTGTVLDPPGIVLTDNSLPMISYSYDSKIFTRTNTNASQAELSSAWTAESMVDTGDTPRLARAFGNGGDIVMVNHKASTGLLFRRANLDVFGASTQIVTGQTAFWNIAGDGGGHLHVVWWNNSSDRTVRYRRMAADGTFSDATTLSGNAEDVRDFKVAANASGDGLVVWNNGPSLRAARLVLPAAPEPTPTPTPSPTPTPTPTPGPTPTPPVKGPKLSLGPKKTKLSKKGTITIKVGCPTSAGAKCVGSLTVRPHGKKSKVGSAKLSIAAGKSAGVPVTLNAATRRKIKKLKKKKTLTFDVIADATAGGSDEAKTTLVIKVGKK